MEWIVQIPILFFSVVVHEVSHGLLAWARGDDTAEKAGRLTLNPIPHVDPFGTIVLPMLCHLLHAPLFAWAKPVPVNPRRMKQAKRDLMQVALVGPGANVALAVVAAILFKVSASVAIFTPAFQSTVLDALAFAIHINLFLAFFNLIPVHPLDGSKVMSGLLPKRLRLQYDRHIPYGMAILMLLMLTNATRWIVVLPSSLTLDLFNKLGLIW
ncbi:MAG: site-2 protease family protein [Proteobacteria bacterium]|nr:site-2 protease family protein [Pseudomonadota bacterium]